MEVAGGHGRVVPNRRDRRMAHHLRVAVQRHATIAQEVSDRAAKVVEREISHAGCSLGLLHAMTPVVIDGPDLAGALARTTTMAQK